MLTANYDEGRSMTALEQMGQNLTARGLPVHTGKTGVDGLVVTNTYELPGAAAEAGSERVDGAS
jgi:hypothetical protein